MKRILSSTIPCSVSSGIMLYGSFAILCQLVFMALHISILLGSHSMGFVSYTYIPYFEYPILSLALIFGGAWLIDYVTLKSE